MGSHSITDSHIQHYRYHIVASICRNKGEMARALNVLKCGDHGMINELENLLLLTRALEIILSN